MANVSDLLPRVLPFAPACLDLLAERAILDAAIDFCEQTHLVVETKTASVPAGGPVPALTFATGMQPFFIASAYWDKREIAPTTTDDLDAKRPGWRDYGQGTPFAVYIDPLAPASPTLINTPSQDGELIIRYATMPLRTATTIPDALANFWPDAIAFGALWRLLRLPKQPFSDGAAALAYLQMFKDEVAKARIVAFDQGASGGRSEVRRFAFGSR